MAVSDNDQVITVGIKLETKGLQDGLALTEKQLVKLGEGLSKGLNIDTKKSSGGLGDLNAALKSLTQTFNAAKTAAESLNSVNFGKAASGSATFKQMLADFKTFSAGAVKEIQTVEKAMQGMTLGAKSRTSGLQGPLNDMYKQFKDFAAKASKEVDSVEKSLQGLTLGAKNKTSGLQGPLNEMYKQFKDFSGKAIKEINLVNDAIAGIGTKGAKGGGSLAGFQAILQGFKTFSDQLKKEAAGVDGIIAGVGKESGKGKGAANPFAPMVAGLKEVGNTGVAEIQRVHTEVKGLLESLKNLSLQTFSIKTEVSVPSQQPIPNIAATNPSSKPRELPRPISTGNEVSGKVSEGGVKQDPRFAILQGGGGGSGENTLAALGGQSIGGTLAYKLESGEMTLEEIRALTQEKLMQIAQAEKVSADAFGRIAQILASDHIDAKEALKKLGVDSELLPATTPNAAGSRSNLSGQTTIFNERKTNQTLERMVGQAAAGTVRGINEVTQNLTDDQKVALGTQQVLGGAGNEIAYNRKLLEGMIAEFKKWKGLSQEERQQQMPDFNPRAMLALLPSTFKQFDPSALQAGQQKSKELLTEAGMAHGGDALLRLQGSVHAANATSSKKLLEQEIDKIANLLEKEIFAAPTKSADFGGPQFKSSTQQQKDAIQRKQTAADAETINDFNPQKDAEKTIKAIKAVAKEKDKLIDNFAKLHQAIKQAFDVDPSKLVGAIKGISADVKGETSATRRGRRKKADTAVGEADLPSDSLYSKLASKVDKEAIMKEHNDRLAKKAAGAKAYQDRIAPDLSVAKDSSFYSKMAADAAGSKKTLTDELDAKKAYKAEQKKIWDDILREQKNIDTNKKQLAELMAKPEAQAWMNGPKTGQQLQQETKDKLLGQTRTAAEEGRRLGQDSRENEQIQRERRQRRADLLEKQLLERDASRERAMEMRKQMRREGTWASNGVDPLANKQAGQYAKKTEEEAKGGAERVLGGVRSFFQKIEKVVADMQAKVNTAVFGGPDLAKLKKMRKEDPEAYEAYIRTAIRQKAAAKEAQRAAEATEKVNKDFADRLEKGKQAGRALKKDLKSQIVGVDEQGNNISAWKDMRNNTKQGSVLDATISGRQGHTGLYANTASGVGPNYDRNELRASIERSRQERLAREAAGVRSGLAAVDDRTTQAAKEESKTLLGKIKDNLKNVLNIGEKSKRDDEQFTEQKKGILGQTLDALKRGTNSVLDKASAGLGLGTGRRSSSSPEAQGPISTAQVPSNATTSQPKAKQRGYSWDESQAELNRMMRSADSEGPVKKSGRSNLRAAAKDADDLTDIYSKALQKLEVASERSAKNSSSFFSTYFSANLFSNLVTDSIMRLQSAVTSFFSEITVYAARTQEMEVVMGSLARVNNLSHQSMMNQVQSMKMLGITTQDSIETMSRFVNVGFDIQKAAPLSRVAQDLAVIGNKTTAEELNSLVVAIQTLQSRNLRSAGVYMTVDEVLDRLAKTTGRARNSFSTLEKQTAVLNAVLDYGAKVGGTYDAAMETASKQSRSLDRYQKEMANNMGTQLIPVFELWIKLQTFAFKTLATYPKTVLLVAGAIATLVVGIKALNSNLGATMGMGVANKLLAIGDAYSAVKGAALNAASAVGNLRNAQSVSSGVGAVASAAFSPVTGLYQSNKNQIINERAALYSEGSKKGIEARREFGSAARAFNADTGGLGQVSMKTSAAELSAMRQKTALGSMQHRQLTAMLLAENQIVMAKNMQNEATKKGITLAAVAKTAAMGISAALGWITMLASVGMMIYSIYSAKKEAEKAGPEVQSVDINKVKMFKARATKARGIEGDINDYQKEKEKVAQLKLEFEKTPDNKTKEKDFIKAEQRLAEKKLQIEQDIEVIAGKRLDIEKESTAFVKARLEAQSKREAALAQVEGTKALKSYEETAKWAEKSENIRKSNFVDMQMVIEAGTLVKSEKLSNWGREARKETGKNYYQDSFGTQKVYGITSKEKEDYIKIMQATDEQFAKLEPLLNEVNKFGQDTTSAAYGLAADKLKKEAQATLGTSEQTSAAELITIIRAIGNKDVHDGYFPDQVAEVEKASKEDKAKLEAAKEQLIAAYDAGAIVLSQIPADQFSESLKVLSETILKRAAEIERARSLMGFGPNQEAAKDAYSAFSKALDDQASNDMQAVYQTEKDKITTEFGGPGKDQAVYEQKMNELNKKFSDPALAAEYRTTALASIMANPESEKYASMVDSAVAGENERRRLAGQDPLKAEEIAGWYNNDFLPNLSKNLPKGTVSIRLDILKDGQLVSNTDLTKTENVEFATTNKSGEKVPATAQEVIDNNPIKYERDLQAATREAINAKDKNKGKGEKSKLQGILDNIKAVQKDMANPAIRRAEGDLGIAQATYELEKAKDVILAEKTLKSDILKIDAQIVVLRRGKNPKLAEAEKELALAQAKADTEKALYDIDKEIAVLKQKLATDTLPAELAAQKKILEYAQQRREEEKDLGAQIAVNIAKMNAFQKSMGRSARNAAAKAFADAQESRLSTEETGLKDYFATALALGKDSLFANNELIMLANEQAKNMEAYNNNGGAVGQKLDKTFELTQKIAEQNGVQFNYGQARDDARANSIVDALRTINKTVAESGFGTAGDIAGVALGDAEKGFAETDPELKKRLGRDLQGKANAWCARYVGTVLKELGYELPAGFDSVSSWTGYGKEAWHRKGDPEGQNMLKGARVGSLLVFKDNDKSHISIITGIDRKTGKIKTVGGNESDGIRKKERTAAQLLEDGATTIRLPVGGRKKKLTGAEIENIADSTPMGNSYAGESIEEIGLRTRADLTDMLNQIGGILTGAKYADNPQLVDRYLKALGIDPTDMSISYKDETGATKKRAATRNDYMQPELMSFLPDYEKIFKAAYMNDEDIKKVFEGNSQLAKEYMQTQTANMAAWTALQNDMKGEEEARKSRSYQILLRTQIPGEKEGDKPRTFGTVVAEGKGKAKLEEYNTELAIEATQGRIIRQYDRHIAQLKTASLLGKAGADETYRQKVLGDAILDQENENTNAAEEYVKLQAKIIYASDSRTKASFDERQNQLYINEQLSEMYSTYEELVKLEKKRADINRDSSAYYQGLIQKAKLDIENQAMENIEAIKVASAMNTDYYGKGLAYADAILEKTRERLEEEQNGYKELLKLRLKALTYEKDGFTRAIELQTKRYERSIALMNREHDLRLALLDAEYAYQDKLLPMNELEVRAKLLENVTSNMQSTGEAFADTWKSAFDMARGALDNAIKKIEDKMGPGGSLLAGGISRVYKSLITSFEKMMIDALFPDKGKTKEEIALEERMNQEKETRGAIITSTEVNQNLNNSIVALGANVSTANTLLETMLQAPAGLNTSPAEMDKFLGERLGTLTANYSKALLNVNTLKGAGKPTAEAEEALTKAREDLLLIGGVFSGRGGKIEKDSELANIMQGQANLYETSRQELISKLEQRDALLRANPQAVIPEELTKSIADLTSQVSQSRRFLTSFNYKFDANGTFTAPEFINPTKKEEQPNTPNNQVSTREVVEKPEQPPVDSAVKAIVDSANTSISIIGSSASNIAVSLTSVVSNISSAADYLVKAFIALGQMFSGTTVETVTSNGANGPITGIKVTPGKATLPEVPKFDQPKGADVRLSMGGNSSDGSGSSNVQEVAQRDVKKSGGSEAPASNTAVSSTGTSLGSSSIPKNTTAVNPSLQVNSADKTTKDWSRGAARAEKAGVYSNVFTGKHSGLRKNENGQWGKYETDSHGNMVWKPAGEKEFGDQGNWKKQYSGYGGIGGIAPGMLRDMLMSKGLKDGVKNIGQNLKATAPAAAGEAIGMLGAYLGRGSVTGSILGSTAGAVAGAFGSAIASGSATFMGMATLGTAIPVVGAIIGGILVAAWLFGRRARRKKEQNDVNKASGETIKELQKILKDVQNDKIDGETAVEQAKELKKNYLDQLSKLTTKPGKALRDQRAREMDSIIAQIEVAAKEQKLRKETDQKIVATYYTGGMPQAGEMALVGPGEAFFTPDYAGEGEIDGASLRGLGIPGLNKTAPSYNIIPTGGTYAGKGGDNKLVSGIPSGSVVANAFQLDRLKSRKRFTGGIIPKYATGGVVGQQPAQQNTQIAAVQALHDKYKVPFDQGRYEAMLAEFSVVSSRQAALPIVFGIFSRKHREKLAAKYGIQTAGISTGEVIKKIVEASKAQMTSYVQSPEFLSLYENYLQKKAGIAANQTQSNFGKLLATAVNYASFRKSVYAGARNYQPVKKMAMGGVLGQLSALSTRGAGSMLAKPPSETVVTVAPIRQANSTKIASPSNGGTIQVNVAPGSTAQSEGQQPGPQKLTIVVALGDEQARQIAGTIDGPVVIAKVNQDIETNGTNGVLGTILRNLSQ